MTAPTNNAVTSAGSNSYTYDANGNPSTLRLRSALRASMLTRRVSNKTITFSYDAEGHPSTLPYPLAGAYGGMGDGGLSPAGMIRPPRPTLAPASTAGAVQVRPAPSEHEHNVGEEPKAA